MTPEMGSKEETAHGPSADRQRDGGEPLRRKTVIIVAAALASIAGLAALAIWGGADTRPAQAPSASTFAREYQRYSAFDLTPMSEAGVSLVDVAGGTSFGGEPVDGDLVGSGRVTDLRLGYAEQFTNAGDGSTSELRHMLMAVEPSRITEGEDRFEGREVILIDLLAPPVDRETGDRALGELAEAIVGSPVTFILSEVKPQDAAADDERIVDEQSGRDSGEAVFAPTLPSTLLGVEAETAFPLITDEKIDNSKENLEFLESTGAAAKQFGPGSTEVAPGTSG